MRTHYFKCYQRGELWSYYKLMSEREPPACEVVNFFRSQPTVELREYDLSDPGQRIDFDAFWDVGVRISAQEYQAAYQRATADRFTLYINGRVQ
ncbi:hypothetical protein [Spirosoma linguale]|uniref:Uncharacterized protein n=1 Tax=Spirosoma linguale (strain ATCC 33905 / DSM 74 / LMG 10896 / Claus 1) TaxID=504472 RepID=D2QW00_SPILD|nr:hypothetical protein Slin_7039 [Spirosoma linguale DSM 74]